MAPEGTVGTVLSRRSPKCFPRHLILAASGPILRRSEGRGLEGPVNAIDGMGGLG